MEGYLHAALGRCLEEVGNACHPIFGTYVYGTISDGEYVYHSDGRNK